MNTYMKLRIALLIFSLIGFILYIVAFAVPKWAKQSIGNKGLWQMCYLNGGVETCSVWVDSLKTCKYTYIYTLTYILQKWKQRGTEHEIWGRKSNSRKLTYFLEKTQSNHITYRTWHFRKRIEFTKTNIFSGKKSQSNHIPNE
jgi:hypothetical protein